MNNIGKIVVNYKDPLETGGFATYAVGATGYIQLFDGRFFYYDYAIPGPEFFSEPFFFQCRVDWS